MAISNAPLWPFVPVAGWSRRFVRAKGSYLYDDTGRAVLDAGGGAIVINVGHCRDAVIAATAEAMRQLTYVTPPFETPERTMLVSKLRDNWLPRGIERVHLSSGGSEAMDAAMRLARQSHVAAGRPERRKFIGREIAYHGTTLTTLAAGDHAARRQGLETLFPDILRVPACYPLRAPGGRFDPDCGAQAAAALEAMILKQGPETIAAFIAEPIVGSSGGAIVPPDDYWPAVRDICDRHGVYIIADEVMTGFGRTGRNFAADHWQLVPDIIVSGKGLAGGYMPIVGVFARDEVVLPLEDAGWPLMFYTYGAHPAACAAAHAVLTILEEEKLVARVAGLEPEFRAMLEDKLKDHPHIAEIRGQGLLWAVEIVRDRETLARFDEAAQITAKVVAAALERDVLLYPGGTGSQRDIVCMGPPFIVTEPELARIADTLCTAINVATGRKPGP
ncbi:MAG TPA: aspartate aminotransferase family protein [Alphaproteobacteria bacterium]|nr:aspartate aminotransferase family protein [Alphaproteobacteria bacterium]